MGCEVLCGNGETVLYPPHAADRSDLIECGKSNAGEVPRSDMAPGAHGSVKMCAEHLGLVNQLRIAQVAPSSPLHVTVTCGGKTLVDVDWTLASIAGQEIT